MRKYRMCVILGVPILLASFSIAFAQMAGQSGSTESQKPAPADLSGLWLVHPSASASAYSSFAFAKERSSHDRVGRGKIQSRQAGLRAE